MILPRTPDDKLRWAFKMYDEDNSREVDIHEMENVMVAIFNMLEGAGLDLEAMGDPREKAHYFFK
jgi:Ca2+-binding EF-hand superfamily protein